MNEQPQLPWHVLEAYVTTSLLLPRRSKPHHGLQRATLRAAAVPGNERSAAACA
jgi:hypothetical protein